MFNKKYDKNSFQQILKKKNSTLIGFCNATNTSSKTLYDYFNDEITTHRQALYARKLEDKIYKFSLPEEIKQEPTKEPKQKLRKMVKIYVSGNDAIISELTSGSVLYFKDEESSSVRLFNGLPLKSSGDESFFWGGGSGSYP